MPDSRFIIGSRGSDLALYQARLIRDQLVANTGCRVEIEIIKTQGDRIDQLAFDKMEGKGFFTRELEEALLDGSIDIAVHSLKDLPTTEPEGLKLAAVGFRADRREILLIAEDAHSGEGLLPVKPGRKIGTSSARRRAQIRYHNPGLEVVNLRGNVPTRVRKLREGQYDAIVIAAAGVDRLELDLSGLVAMKLDPEQFLPAPAQGVLGIQIRANNRLAEEIVAPLNSATASAEVGLERGLLARFDGGCSLPLGVFSELGDDSYRLVAVLGGADSGLNRAEAIGDSPEQVIDQVFLKLTD